MKRWSSIVLSVGATLLLASTAMSTRGHREVVSAKSTDAADPARVVDNRHEIITTPPIDRAVPTSRASRPIERPRASIDPRDRALRGRLVARGRRTASDPHSPTYYVTLAAASDRAPGRIEIVHSEQIAGGGNRRAPSVLLVASDAGHLDPLRGVTTFEGGRGATELSRFIVREVYEIPAGRALTLNALSRAILGDAAALEVTGGAAFAERLLGAAEAVAPRQARRAPRR